MCVPKEERAVHVGKEKKINKFPRQKNNGQRSVLKGVHM